MGHSPPNKNPLTLPYSCVNAYLICSTKVLVACNRTSPFAPLRRRQYFSRNNSKSYGDCLGKFSTSNCRRFRTSAMCGADICIVHCSHRHSVASFNGLFDINLAVLHRGHSNEPAYVPHSVGSLHRWHTQSKHLL